MQVSEGDPTEAAVVAVGEPGSAARRGKLKAEGDRLVVGIGEGSAEDVRSAAAAVVARAKELDAADVGWDGPHGAAFAEGAVLATYAFTAFKSEPPPSDAGGPETVVVRPGEGGAEAGVVAAAANWARDLQNTPGNVATPTWLAERAREIAAEAGLECEVWGRAEIEGAGMGAFAGVARGSEEEPALIVLRYEGPDARGPLVSFVGKAVTFDSGGISIKAGQGMHEMKFDMSGGAAVLGAMKAIAALRLPVRVLAVVGATENLPSGRSMKPGDILTAKTGKTIEVINTDAEGRLVLADCLALAIERGAERLVDLATLTGGIVVTFGKGHAGLFGNDDAWCEAVREAGERTGERLWRLPLDPVYAEMIEGRYADIVNAVENRQAHSITAAEFLAHFVGNVPWVHLDIAGTAWDLGRPYAQKGGSGWGVRMLVELARSWR